MERTRITNLGEFDAIRTRWERLYADDPQAQLFVSWPWLRAYLSGAAQRWTIVLLHDGDELIAALPLAIRPIPMRALPIARELTFATDPVGDYTGMMCRPGDEERAAAAFADEILRMRWDRALFRNVVDERVARILPALRGAGARVEHDADARSFQAALPATWDGYLAERSANTRRKLRDTLKTLDAGLPALRITQPTAGDLERHLDALAGLHYGRWGGNRAKAREKHGRLFRAAFANGCLYLVILWDGDRPIAGSASFVDPVRGMMGGYQTAFDPAYATFSPGKASIVIGIRDAIARGFHTFDFLRGDEEYKRSYASETTIRTNVRVLRPGVRTTLFHLLQPAFRALKAAAVRVVYGPGRSF